MKALTLLLNLTLFLTACQSTRPPIHTVEKVDLARFMGPWYVIANIPTFIEETAYNAVESYRLDSDGTIATTFTFREGAFEGPEKRYEPRGFVVDRKSNAIWDMQFFWPFKSDFRIIYLSDDYGTTIIGREKRDYIWIMARKPVIDATELQKLIRFAGEQGYDTQLIRSVPQQWH